MKQVFTIVGFLILSQCLSAQTPYALPALPYQGFLTDANGQPINNNESRLTFRLYNAAGERLWYEVKEPVKVQAGKYAVWLGGPGNQLTQETLAAPCFLEIQVGDSPPMARQPIGLSMALVQLDGKPGAAGIVAPQPSQPKENDHGPFSLAREARLAWIRKKIDEGNTTIYKKDKNGQPVLDKKTGEFEIDYKRVPVFITRDEFNQQPGFGNWTRLHGGAMFVPKSGVTPFVLVQPSNARFRVQAIVQDETGGFNIEKTPVPIRATTDMITRHFGDMSGRPRWYTAFGISASKVGDDKAATDEKTAFFAGMTYIINPYVSVNAGSVILRGGSGIRLRPGVGFAFDVGSLSSIFTR